jgi:hypothetical protein
MKKLISLFALIAAVVIPLTAAEPGKWGQGANLD